MADLCVLCDDGRLQWFRPEGKGGWTLLQSVEGAGSFGWSASGRSVAFGGQEDGSVAVLAGSGKRMLHLERAARDAVTSVLFSVHNYLFVGSEEGIIRVWNAQAGRPPQLVSGLEGHTDAVTSMVFNRVFSLLASCSAAGDILLHNVQRGGSATTLCDGSTLDDMGLNRLALRPREAAQLGSVAESGAFRIWDVNRTGAPVQSYRAHSGPSTDLAFNSDALAATVGLDGLILLYDLRAKSNCGQLDTGTMPQSVAFDHAGRVAVGNDEGSVRFYDIRKGALVDSGDAPLIASADGTAAVTGLCFGPSKQQLQTAQSQQGRAFSVASMPPAALEKFALSGASADAVGDEEDEDGEKTSSAGVDDANARPVETPDAGMLFSPTRTAGAIHLGQDTSVTRSSSGSKPHASEWSLPSPGKTVMSAPSPFWPPSVAGSAVPRSVSGLKPPMTPSPGQAREPEATPVFRVEHAGSGAVRNATRPLTTPTKEASKAAMRSEVPTSGSSSSLAPPSSISYVTEKAAEEPTAAAASIVHSEELAAIKLQMHQEISTLHIEMLRMFHQQRQEMQRLVRAVEELTAENERLRHRLK